MNIKGPEMRFSGSLPVSPLKILSERQPQQTGNPPGAISNHLLKILTENGYNISNENLDALASELISAGLSQSGLDSATVIRALLLKQINIPFEKEVLKNSWESGKTIFYDISGLLEETLSVLREPILSAKEKESAGKLLDGIKAYLSGNSTEDSVKINIRNIIDLWGYVIESDLLSYEKGNFSEQKDLTGFETVIQSLLKPAGDDSLKGQTGEFIEKLRDYIITLKNRIANIDLNASSAESGIKQALDAFRYELMQSASKAGEILQPSAAGQIYTVSLSEFVSDALKKLETGLSGEILIYKALVSGEPDAGNIFMPYQIKNLLTNSMSFEWQLLMWFRSGRDFKSLEAIFHNNIKAVLINFLNRQKSGEIKDRIKKKMDALDTASMSLLKGIESRQITNILNDTVEKKGFYVELPVSPSVGEGIVKITVQKKDSSRKKRNETKINVVSFQSDTSNVGKINVKMTVSGNNMTLSFGFENEKISVMANSFSDDIRNSLIKRGFIPGIIEFHSSEKPKKDSPENYTGKTGNVDIKA